MPVFILGIKLADILQPDIKTFLLYIDLNSMQIVNVVHVVNSIFLIASLLKMKNEL